MVILQVSSESDCRRAWLGYTARGTAAGSRVPGLLEPSHCPVGSTLPTLEEASHPSYLPSTQARDSRFSLERPVLQLNVLAFGWKYQKPVENCIFDNFMPF